MKVIENRVEKDPKTANTRVTWKYPTMLAIRKFLVRKPNKKYPKLWMKMDWRNDYVIDKSSDGIVDKPSRSGWSSEQLGTMYLDLQADYLVRKIKSVI